MVRAAADARQTACAVRRARRRFRTSAMVSESKPRKCRGYFGGFVGRDRQLPIRGERAEMQRNPPTGVSYFWSSNPGLLNSQKERCFNGLGGGASGIRTHVRVSPKHAFQACAFNHSATAPHPFGGRAPGGRRVIYEAALAGQAALGGLRPDGAGSNSEAGSAAARPASSRRELASQAASVGAGVGPAVRAGAPAGSASRRRRRAGAARSPARPGPAKRSSIRPSRARARGDHQRRRSARSPAAALGLARRSARGGRRPSAAPTLSGWRGLRGAGGGVEGADVGRQARQHRGRRLRAVELLGDQAVDEGLELAAPPAPGRPSASPWGRRGRGSAWDRRSRCRGGWRTANW